MIMEASQHPAIKAAMNLVPFGIGSALDVFLSDGVRRIHEENVRIFFSEIASGSISLTEERIKSDDFLHRFFQLIVLQ